MNVLDRIDELPPEIKVTIYEYAAERMTKPTISFIPKVVVMGELYKRHIEYLTYSIPGQSLSEYLRDTLYDPEHAFEVLSKCRCCKRHCSRRPISIEYFQEMEPHLPQLPEVREIQLQFICNCRCRMDMRWLGRVFQEQFE